MRDVSRSTDSPGGLFYVPAWCAGAVVQPPPILHGTYIDLGISNGKNVITPKEYE